MGPVRQRELVGGSVASDDPQARLVLVGRRRVGRVASGASRRRGVSALDALEGPPG